VKAAAVAAKKKPVSPTFSISIALVITMRKIRVYFRVLGGINE